MSRRTFLTASGLVLGQVGLTGCGLLGGDEEPGEVSVLSWWSSGGELAALKALIAYFEKNNPNIKVVNDHVGGGVGEEAKAQLARRMKNGNPPDTFQGHAGAELSDYIEADQLEDLTFLYYEEEVWQLAFPDTLLQRIAQDGRIYSVPVNIHRANVLWHNVRVLDAAGVSEPPKTFDQFFTALDRVKARGKTPLAIGEAWTTQHLMETVLLGSLGADRYSDVWRLGSDWGEPAVTKALETFAELLTYTNEDAEGRTWQEACELLGEGTAGFNVMGDWADGHFTVHLDLTPKKDYGWSATPGTDGLYQFLSDSFTLPKGVKHRDAAIAWLKACGSKSGQDAFNPKKGSIPARFDADPKLYGPYLKWALDEWRDNDDIVGSLTHGVVANAAWTGEIGEGLAVFLKDRNVNRFQDALAEAARKHAV